MLGALLGDIAGSVYEHANCKRLDCELFGPGSRFTDDSVLTVATAAALLGDGDYAAAYREFGRRHMDAGYGASFIRWLFSDRPAPYGSWGNGSAMRVSPVGWVCDSLDEVLVAARRSATVTHDHPEGIKGAQAVAAAVFLARGGTSRDELRDYLGTTFDYDLGRTIAEIRPGYVFDVSCQGSVPEALIAFLESSGFEDALRRAISLGGDSDTLACIAGAVAHAYYRELPQWMVERARALLSSDMKVTLDAFLDLYPEAAGGWVS